MIVIGHHLEVVNLYVKAFRDFDQDLDDELVRPFLEDKDPAIGPGGDVVGILILQYTKGSAHALIA